MIDNQIIYAHQLHVVEQSDLKATVKQSYFKGSCYLVEADLEDQTLLLESKKALPIGANICLKISK